MTAARITRDGLAAVAGNGARAQIWETAQGWSIGYWSARATRMSAHATLADEAAARRALAAWAEDH